MDQATISFIKSLPKAELHLHIEGSLEPELMFTLAKRNNITLPYNSPAEIKAAYEFDNLQSFLDIYYQGASVLQTEQDFFDLTMAYLKKAHEDGVTHVEIFFDPQTHTDRGITFETVVTGIDKALQQAKSQYNISSYLIMCFLRHLSEEKAFQTLEQALPFQNKIKAVGLDSSEIGNPPEKFKKVFAKATALGLLTVAHAGEEGDSGYIWSALGNLHVKRIDHGVQCLQDPKLVTHLKNNQIPLTVCPLSNIKLKVFETLEKHNLKEMLSQGLCVTINSDDPAYFGGYILENFIACQTALSLSKQDIAQLAINSFKASFLPNSEKSKHINRIKDLNA